MLQLQHQLQIVERRHPQLAPLVRSGVLRVVEKPPPATYDEGKRRRKFWKEDERGKPREPQHIYLVGTCHVSTDSARVVKQVIEEVKPQAVVVELCKKRSGALTLPEYDENDKESKEDNFDRNVTRTTREREEEGGGRWERQFTLSSVFENLKERGERVFAGLAASTSSTALATETERERKDRAGASSSSSSSSSSSFVRETWMERTTKGMLKQVLTAQANRIGKELNVIPGVEFRQAARSAEVVGAEVVLGDRPIDITLQRCWENMTLEEKLKMGLVLSQTLIQRGDLSKQVAEEITSTETEFDLDVVFAQVSAYFPGLVEPLFKERDRYMAWTLKRSKAVTNCHSVVGVLGRGHLNAVVEEIEKDYELQHLTFQNVARLQ